MKRFLIGVVLIVAVVAAWVEHAVVLGALGGLVVEETPLARADLVVVMSNLPRVAAEAAAIVKAGYAPRVALFPALPRPDDEVLRKLAIDVMSPHDVAVRVLQASGVLAQRVDLLPHAPDGTNEAVREIARYARRHGITRIIAVAERSHTRRTARLLRRELAENALVMVRSAPRDDFRPDAWWQDRGAARELAMEGLRWWNSFALRDWWKTTRPRSQPAA